MRSELTVGIASSVDGQPLTGINVTIKNRDDSPATVYGSPAGAALSTNVVQTSRGNVTAWLETGSYKLVIEHPDIETRIEYFEAVAGDDVKVLLAAKPTLYFGPSPPISPPAAYMWIETGLGTSGTDWTVWFNDGS